MNLFRYLYAYFRNDTKELRNRASKEARVWLLSQGRGEPHYTDAYRAEFRAFTRAYINSELHVKAKRYVLEQENNRKNKK